MAFAHTLVCSVIDFQPQEIPIALFGHPAMKIRAVSSFSNESAVVATDDKNLFFIQIQHAHKGQRLLQPTVRRNLNCRACDVVEGIDHVAKNLAVVCNRRHCVYFHFIN
jgi:hypothetical protein